MKLVLFQTTPRAEILPGVLNHRGVIDISGAVKKSYTPQLTMQGIIDGFDWLHPALEKIASEGAALSLASVRLRPPLPRPGKILACIARARSDSIESETRSRFLIWSHFLRRTGSHFAGKCSNYWEHAQREARPRD